MTSKTHATLGLLTGIIILRLNPTLDTYVVMSGTIIGSLLPDLDTKKSDPSQIFPFVSWVVDRFTKHRGWTHASFPLILIIAYLYYKYLPYLALGVGALSHMIIDEVTMAVGIRCYKKGSKDRGEIIIYWSLWILIGVILISWLEINLRGWL
jgi:membrane-bound metal-dependent hydrolase YbcI (DUF457 family)